MYNSGENSGPRQSVQYGGPRAGDPSRKQKDEWRSGSRDRASSSSTQSIASEAYLKTLEMELRW